MGAQRERPTISIRVAVASHEYPLMRFEDYLAVLQFNVHKNDDCDPTFIFFFHYPITAYTNLIIFNNYTVQLHSSRTAPLKIAGFES